MSKLGTFDLPSGWNWAQVGELGEVVTGNTPSTKEQGRYYGEQVPSFKPTDLNAGYYVKEAFSYLTEEGAVKARLIPTKSTLVTCIGATIGKVGFSRVRGAVNQQINALIPNSTYIIPEYVYLSTSRLRIRH